MSDDFFNAATNPAVEKFVEAGRLPHLLFYGPPGMLYDCILPLTSQGTGKTSTVLALARRIYGTSFRKHILELNASDDRGIDVVREQIKNFAMTKVLFSCVALACLDGDANRTGRDSSSSSWMKRT